MIRWFYLKFVDKFVVKMFYKFHEQETFEYFYSRSKGFPRWWLNYEWWKPKSLREANPIYMFHYPNERFWE